MSKRILFLTPQLPYPLHQGTILRNYGLIEGLAMRGYEIGLVSFLEIGQPDPAHTPLFNICEQIVTVRTPARTWQDRLGDLLAGRTDLAGRLWSVVFRDRLRQFLASTHFDIVHIEGLEMSPYLDIVRQIAPEASIVYDAHNAEYALQARIAQQDMTFSLRLPQAIYSRIQATRLAFAEATVCRKADLVLTCSKSDAEHMRKLGHQTPIAVIPNSIRVEMYTEMPKSEVPIVRPAILFTGKMDFRPNVDAVLWFAQEILPIVRESVPDAHFTVVGQKPHPRLEVLFGMSGVTLTGMVPDIRPYLYMADVYVTPLRMGSGTRFKVLEAMACQRAIVSTRIGAEGLNVTDRQNILLADTSERFAHAVVELLEDQKLRLALGKAASKLVADTYTWKVIIPQLEEAYTNHVFPSGG